MSDELEPSNTVATDPLDAATPARRAPQRRLIVSGAVVVLVLAVILVVVGLGPSGTSKAGATVAVRDAMNSTLAAKSMSFNLTESITVAGQGINTTGSGACELTTSDCTMTIDYQGALSELGHVTAELSGGVMYLKLGSSADGQLPTPWVSMPIFTTSGSSPSSTGLASSPLAGLAKLASKGAVVTDEGSVSVSGTAMHQYGVSISSAVGQSIVSSSTLKIAPWLKSESSSVLEGTLHMTVDINAAGEIGRLSYTNNVTASGSVATFAETMTPTSYGQPVDVVVPPASQVTPLTSLTNGL